LAGASSGQFHPVPLPDPHVAGYKFPEDEDVIIGWVEKNNRNAIDLHAWGLWTALNQPSGQKYNDEELRVFETWYDPKWLISLGRGKGIRNPRPLDVLRQFDDSGQSLLIAVNPHATATSFVVVEPAVKYDPCASNFIVSNNLFSQSQLDKYLKSDHRTAIPDFPMAAISLKVGYVPIPSGQLTKGRYFPLMAWPGPPPLSREGQVWRSRSFPPSEWGPCIWIDTKGSGNKGGSVDRSCNEDGSSQRAENTYGVDQFINYHMTEEDAKLATAVLKAENPDATAQFVKGDYVVLVAMHVTTREMVRWTWQTFWWTNLPDKPAAPSSASIAAARPAELKGDALRHYAQCSAYEEVVPPHRNSGAQSPGESVYCYNPYLEAKFPEVKLPESLPGITIRNGKKVITPNNVGVQTNCMSCHAMAKYPAQPRRYTGTRPVDQNDPIFKHSLRVDFLWSIADLAN
jgi:hypothetical protein